MTAEFKPEVARLFVPLCENAELIIKKINKSYVR